MRNTTGLWGIDKKKGDAHKPPTIEGILMWKYLIYRGVLYISCALKRASANVTSGLGMRVDL